MYGICVLFIYFSLIEMYFNFQYKVLFYSIDGRLLKKYVSDSFGLVSLTWNKINNFVAIGDSFGEVSLLFLTLLFYSLIAFKWYNFMIYYVLLIAISYYYFYTYFEIFLCLLNYICNVHLSI